MCGWICCFLLAQHLFYRPLSFLLCSKFHGLSRMSWAFFFDLSFALWAHNQCNIRILIFWVGSKMMAPKNVSKGRYKRVDKSHLSCHINIFRQHATSVYTVHFCLLPLPTGDALRFFFFFFVAPMQLKVIFKSIYRFQVRFNSNPNMSWGLGLKSHLG